MCSLPVIGAEVVNVERVRVVAPVPADHIQRVIVVDVRVHLIAGLDAHLELAHLVIRQRQLRQVQVTLAIRRVFEELRGPSSRCYRGGGRMCEVFTVSKHTNLPYGMSSRDIPSGRSSSLSSLNSMR